MHRVSNDEKWEHSIENGIRKGSIGFLAGLLPSLILARSPAARVSVLMLTTGFGAGVAYQEARYLFDHNITFDQRHIVDVKFFTRKD
jgi:hypothetical protein